MSLNYIALIIILYINITKHNINNHIPTQEIREKLFHFAMSTQIMHNILVLSTGPDIIKLLVFEKQLFPWCNKNGKESVVKKLFDPCK